MSNLRCARGPRASPVAAPRLARRRPLALAIASGLAIGAACGNDAPASPDLGPDEGAADLGAVDGGLGRPTPCGHATFHGARGLRRRPYLQSATPTSVRVAWTTTGLAAGAPRLRVRPLAGGEARELDATSRAFPMARTGDRVDYVAHDVIVDGLLPDTVYCYEVLDGDAVLAAELSLRTATDGATVRPLEVLVFGDSGTGLVPQRRLRDVMLEREWDLMLHLGDVAYTEGTWRQLEDFYFTVYADLLHGVPSFLALGNHEYETENGQPYLDVFYLFEQARRPADQERYYSFDYGDVHFVALDSNPEVLRTVGDGSDDDMLDWLRDDLAASSAPWKIAFFHHPPYSTDRRGDDDDVKTRIVPLLEAGGVDLVLSGHHHNYERFVPLLGGAPVPEDARAVHYVVSGAGGTLLAPVLGGPLTAASEHEKHSFLRLRIDGCTASCEATALDGTIVDAFTIDGCEP
jgi:hypothetical protein